MVDLWEQLITESSSEEPKKQAVNTQDIELVLDTEAAVLDDPSKPIIDTSPSKLSEKKSAAEAKAKKKITATSAQSTVKFRQLELKKIEQEALKECNKACEKFCEVMGEIAASEGRFYSKESLLSASMEFFGVALAHEQGQNTAISPEVLQAKFDASYQSLIAREPSIQQVSLREKVLEVILKAGRKAVEPLYHKAVNAIKKWQNAKKLEKPLAKATAKKAEPTKLPAEKPKKEVQAHEKKVPREKPQKELTRQDKKTRGEAEDQLTETGRSQPVALTDKELKQVVYEWSNHRNKILKKWRKEGSITKFDQGTNRLIQKARNSIQDNMTPDDMAAVIKEKRGIKIPKICKETGLEKGFDHQKEYKNAYTSITNAIRRINGKIQEETDVQLKELLTKEVRELSECLTNYVKIVGRPPKEPPQIQIP